MLVLDDMGFADFGCFGSSIETPVIDALAMGGLRYNSFHVTPLCTPTRACLLTGRNHHSVEMGMLADVPTDVPGYRAVLPDSAGTVARVLRDAGYGTFAVGKWHLAPRHESGVDGPFDRWPLGRGFDRYYGFLQGMTDQWVPELTRDNSHVDQPYPPEEGYHLTTDLVDQAIAMVRDQRQANPDKPFFMYFAPGAMHTPHQAPDEWIARYRGRFDHGWDVERRRRFHRQRQQGVVPDTATLTERSEAVREWDSLSTRERVVFARQMEAYAGYLSHTDAEFGRLVEALRETDQLDDTIIMIVADNGADGDSPAGSLFSSYEPDPDIDEMFENLDAFGGHRVANSYARGWGWASNTPFRLWKFYTWLGGVRVPLVIHWPRGIRLEARGEVRTQFAHAIDLMPTILHATGVEAPDTIDGVRQQPLDGASLVTTLHNRDAPDPRPHQYFEMTGSRSIYADGWKATTDHVVRQRALPEPGGSTDFDRDHWALFDLRADFSEQRDVGATNPAKLAELVELWDQEATRNNVYPLTDRYGRPTSNGVAPFPVLHQPRRRYVGRPGGAPINIALPAAIGFNVQMNFGISPTESTEGVIAACYTRGSSFISALPDWAFYLIRGEVIMSYRRRNRLLRSLVGVVDPGRSVIHAVFAPDTADPSLSSVSINGRRIAEVTTAAPGPMFSPRLLLIGRDRGFSTDDYRPPFAFTGTLDSVILEVDPLDGLGIEEREIAADKAGDSHHG
jgi:arylsulfatase